MRPMTAAFERFRKHALALAAAAGLAASLGGGMAPAGATLQPFAPGAPALTAGAHVETAALVSGQGAGGVVAAGPERQVRTADSGGRQPAAAPALGLAVFHAGASGDDPRSSHLFAHLRAGLPAAPSTGPPSLSV